MRAIIAGVRSLRASQDDERAIVPGKLTPLERARIMAHLTGDLLVAAWMKDKTIAILESRMRDHIASLVRYGGTPFSAPALAEIPDVDPAHIDELIHHWNSAPPDIFIFQTGVGTRALFVATDLRGLTDVLLRLLDSAQVVVRGPKPATVLHSRKVRIDCAASDPFTTQEVLAEMHKILLRGKRVVVQRYGETNRELQAALESEGADVIEIVTYRWGLPEDTTPLLRLIGALDRDEIDLVAFTSASQASNLFTVAQYDGKEASLKQSLGRTLVASIGPVCSAAHRKFAVRVDIEAKPPKLGPFIEAINAALSDRRPFGKL
jgi:uroporphyrinogen-III synthase